MAFQPSTDTLYATFKSGTSSYLVTIDSTSAAVLSGDGPTPTAATGRLPIKTDDDTPKDTRIEGLCFCTGIGGGTFLMGMDLAPINTDTGLIEPQLVQINTGTGTATALCTPGQVAEVYGLSSFTEAGDTKPMLFATDGNDIIRGSALRLTNVEAIQASDFRPRTGSVNDGLLYFVARENDGTTTTDELYSIDVEKPNATAIQNSLTLITTTSSLNNGSAEITTTSIAWEVSGGTTATLYGYRATGEAGNLITIDETTGVVIDSVNVTLAGEAVMDITAIQFAGDDTLVSEQNIIAVSGTNLLRVNVATGRCYILGPLSDPDDTESPISGEGIQGLSWNPLLINPFTGELGVLLGSDVETDELVALDHRPRFPTADAFSIYVSQSSSDASISISRVPDLDVEVRPMLPYDGSVGSLRIEEAQAGELIVIAAPGGTGEVYIGARTEDLDPDDPEDDLIPILSGNIYDESGVNWIALGVRAQNVDDLPDPADTDTVSAGVVVARSLLAYVSNSPDLQNRLLGQNLDDVQEIAVDNASGAVVVDSDAKDASGQSIDGDQIATVNTTTGAAAAPVTITDALTGEALSNIGGLAYGDYSVASGWLAGDQTLFAVYEINSMVPTANVGGSLGVANNFVATTVTQGGVMYAIDDNGGAGTNFDLYRIERDITGVVTSLDLIGEIRTPQGLVTEISALEADPATGTLYIVGLDPNTGDQTLYRVGISPQDIDNDGSSDDAFADAVGALDTGTLVAGNVAKGLAFSYNATTGARTLYAVIDDGVADTLYTIDYTSGAVLSDEGAVSVGGFAADTDSMDFFTPTRLLAIDDGDPGGRRLIQIDLSAPAADSFLVDSTVDADLVGYAFDRFGIGYSINTGGALDEVWASPGEVSTLGMLDATTGVFTRVGIIQNGSTVLSGVKSMAFRGGPSSLQINRDALYVIDGDGVLHEINPANGTIVSTGYSFEEADATVIGIESMDFDITKGLYGHDLANGRLVDIALGALQPFGAPADTLIVGANVATTVGSLRPTISSISYDYDFATATGRFLTVDNATGNAILANESDPTESSVLMELYGYATSSAVSQNIDNVLIGGTLTGMVNISGSVEDKFYAGWLLTGNANGQLEEAAPAPRVDNFNVGGDLRNLVVNAAIGTLDGTGGAAPTYVTGFDLEVGGKIGQVWTLDTLIGQIHSQNKADFLLPFGATNTSQGEIEDLTDAINPEGAQFQLFELYRADGAFLNDTFETAQYLGTMGSLSGAAEGEIHVTGIIQGDYGDHLDYYGVSLLAGQTVTVQLPNAPFVGVFDPDGRLIASEYSDVDFRATKGQEFRFTADRPGVYRLAVGGAPFDGSVSYSGLLDYELHITNVGNLAVGGIKANNDIFNNSVNFNPGIIVPSIDVDRGDLGAVRAGGFLYFDDEAALDIRVTNGNLRTLEAASIGRIEEGSISNGATIEVPNGDVGLIQATGTGENDYLYIDTFSSIGGNFQVIDAIGGFVGFLSANGGLGVLRAGEMITRPASSIRLNRDGVGDDGIIDLIDVEGDFGANGPGGAQIDTGLNGDVRYMRVGGLIYQDVMFGGGDYNGTILNPGQVASITDDSGGTINLTPRAVAYLPGSGLAVDPATGRALQPDELPFLTYRTYGIRGSGGSVLVDVTSTGGCTISANSNGVGAPVQIGRITVNGPGIAMIQNGDGVELDRQPRFGVEQHLNVTIGGSTANPVDVFEIIGGNFSSIRNTTGGEIVNVVANSISSLYAVGSIGVAKNSTGAAVNPRLDLVTANAFVPEGYPFLQQHIGIVVSGHVDSILSRSAIGNVMVDGQIDRIQANQGQAVNPNDANFNGLSAPIFATGDIGAAYIGEGIAPSGAGEFAHAGLFSLGEIRTVRNDGTGGDIRGAVVGARGVGTVLLTNGSIINADIIAGTLGSAVEYDPMTFSGDVGAITTTGTGGVIGALIGARSIGNITVRNGFGMFNSDVYSIDGNGTIGNTTVDGFGVRMVQFEGGNDQGNITATGRGTVVDPGNYSAAVRYSETQTWLPGTNQRLSPLNDIHEFLTINLSDSTYRQGLLEDVWAHGNGDLGMVSGYRIRTDHRREGARFDFANSIQGFLTYPIQAGALSTNSFDVVEITTGSLGSFNPAQDVNSLTMTIAGEIRSINIRGSFLGTSSITTEGPNGNIRTLSIAGDMVGDVTSSGVIGNMTVGGDLTGDIVVSPTTAVRYALTRLTVGGSYNGSLDVLGNVGTIDIGANLGAVPAVAGQSLQINGNLDRLSVGRRAVDSSMTLALNVLGNLKTMDLTITGVGVMTGNIWIDGDMRSAKITSVSDVDGNVTVMGSLRSLTATLSGGAAWNSTLTAGNSLGTATITNGDLAVGGSIICSLGDIRSVNIRGGDLLGTVSAPNGTIGSITVTGSDLGVASLIEASQLNTLRLDGSILSGARIVIDNELRMLMVGGNVQAGSTISMGSSRMVLISGNLAGDLTLGNNSGRAMLRIGGDIGGNLSVDTDATLFVTGDIAAGANVHIGFDLSMLRVGDILGNLFVDGAARMIMAANITDAVVTTGRDISTLRVTGNVTRSLIQAGINRGDDNDFATEDDNGSQIVRMGQIQRFQANNVGLSIIAAGGAIRSAMVSRNLTNSSISSGLVIHHTQIDWAVNNPIVVVGDLNNMRGLAGNPVTLLRGDFSTASVRGAMTNSTFSAGVDPGVNGIFQAGGDDTVSTSLTGGNSTFRSATVTTDGGGSLVTYDRAPARALRVPAGIATWEENYAIADIAGGAPIEGVVLATVSQAVPQPAPIAGITVVVIGAGQVEIRHTGASGASIDTLVISGTSSRTRINITGGGSIGRMITEDNVAVGTLTYDGILFGNGNALWLDAGVSTFTLNEYGDNAEGGRIGGDVRTMALATQGNGTLRIGGQVSTLTIVNGRDPLLNDAGAVNPGDAISEMVIPAAATTTWVFNDTTQQLEEWNANTGVQGAAMAVTDALGATLTLTGLAYDGANIIAVADSAWSYAPTIEVGNLADVQSWLTGLAVNVNGQIYAAENAEIHDLVGDLGVDLNNITAVAVNPSGTKYVYDSVTTRLYTVTEANGQITGLTAIGVLEEDVSGQVLLSVSAMDFGKDINDNDVLYLIGTRAGLAGEMKLYQVDATTAVGTEIDFYQADTISEAPAASSVPGADVEINTTQNHAATWLVGDTVRDYATNGVTWSGTIIQIVGTQIDVALTVGVLADVTQAGGIEHAAPALLNDITALSVSSPGRINAIERRNVDTEDWLIGLETDGTYFDFGQQVLVGGVDTTIIGMDVDAQGYLMAIDRGVPANGEMIRIHSGDPSLSWRIGEDDATLTNVDGFATNAAGEFFTVDPDGANNDKILHSNGRDRLVQINATTGAYSAVGYLQDIYGNFYYQDVYTLAFNNGTTLYTILKDADGMGGAQGIADGAALAIVATTASSGNVQVSKPDGTYAPAQLLSDGGAVVDTFSAMAVNSDDEIFAVRNNVGNQHLVTITPGGVTSVPGAANLLPVADVLGMGFIANAGVANEDDLVMYNVNGANAQLYSITAAAFAAAGANPEQAATTAVAMTAANALNADIDAYALGRTGTAYAYDQDPINGPFGHHVDHYGLVYKSAGVVESVMGVVNTGTGVFTQYLPLAQDIAGTPLSSSVSSMTYSAGEVYVVTDDGRIVQYDGTDGALRTFAENADALTQPGVAAPISGLVTIITDATNTEHLSWAVGDILQDSLSNGNAWIGTISSIPDTHTFVLSLTFGAAADVTVANGVERRYEVPAVGTIVDAITGETLHVTEMDFDDATLLGLERQYSRLVEITPNFAARIAVGETTLTATPRTESGSVDIADLTALAADNTAGAGVLYTFSASDEEFKTFAGTTQAALAGITLSSVRSLNLGGGVDPYQGRIIATGNTFQTVTVTGDFAGVLYTTSSISRYTQRGNFSGSLYAGASMGTLSITGNVQNGSLINTPGYLSSLQVSGVWDGALAAGRVGRMRLGSVGVNANTRVSGLAGMVQIGGNVAGLLDLGSTSNLMVSGNLLGTANIRIRGNASTVRLSGGTVAGSMLKVDGYVRTLAGKGDHQGVIAIDRGASNVQLGTLTNGIVVIGQNVSTLTVAGNVNTSVISIGTTIGADGIYNTADDRITGGSLRTGNIRGNFYSSALVAGVLPKLADGPDIPTDMRAYTGNAGVAAIADIDSAECGGVLPSAISRLTFFGSTGTVVAGNVSAVASESIGTITRRQSWSDLYQREYTDPIGAPEFLDLETITVSPKEIHYIFSEEINSASFILSQDTDDDGTVTGVADVLGTVLIRDAAGVVLDDVVLSYTTRTTAAGVVQGVLIARREVGFTTAIITFSGGPSYPDPVIYGRSGMRSALFGLPSGPTDTILDGNPSQSLSTEDMPDTFVEASNTTGISISQNTQYITSNDFDTASDVDVYYIDASGWSAWEYLSIQYTGTAWATMALFYQDDQGRVDTREYDTFEMMARYEMNVDENGVLTTTIFEAFELPAAGGYYLVLDAEQASSTVYTLEFTRATSDTELVSLLGGALPTGEEIAYISNTVGLHDNNLGANAPQQLVYLNFTGGTTTDYSYNVPVSAFDIADFAPSLDGNEATLIADIVTNVASIFTNTPANYIGAEVGPLVVRADDFGFADWTAATEGIWLTTTDPSTWGLDPTTDYTTCFIGNADDSVFSYNTLLGIASNIDVAGQDKADNAIVFAQNFSGYPTTGSTQHQLTQYSYAFGNTVAHELGHTFGLNHQPTSFVEDSWMLLKYDDPDNDGLPLYPLTTSNGSNQGPALMAYADSKTDIDYLLELGTADLSSDEFAIGQIDTVDLLIRWFA